MLLYLKHLNWKGWSVTVQTQSPTEQLKEKAQLKVPLATALVGNYLFTENSNTMERIFRISPAKGTVMKIYLV